MRLVDADKLLEDSVWISGGFAADAYTQGYMDGLDAVEKAIRTAPTINPEDLRPKGAWLYKDNEKYYWYECSVCGEHTPTKWCMNEWLSPFCPNCGAKMESTEG